MGGEALNVAHLSNYDYVIYCSAGNGLWGRKDKVADMERNIRSFDPKRVVVVLLGTAHHWSKLAGKLPSNATFFEDAKGALLRRGVRVAELTTYMEGLHYSDEWGHPAKRARIGLVEKLMDTFRELALRPQSAPTAARPLPPPPPPLEPVLEAVGGDVLDTEKEDLGWEEDLREKHGVVQPNRGEGGARKGWWWCKICEVEMPSWSQVTTHLIGRMHKKKTGATLAPKAIGFVRPAASLDTQGWPPLLRHAKAGNVEHVSTALEAGADPNGTAAPGDDRTPLFWAAWEGHHLVVTRLLLDPRAKAIATEDCRGLLGVPANPCSPMKAAHENWGETSDTFAAFGVLHPDYKGAAP